MKHPILVGFSDAMDLVFLVGACVLAVAVVLSVMLKEVPLRTQSGLQAARAAAAAACRRCRRRNPRSGGDRPDTGR